MSPRLGFVTPESGQVVFNELSDKAIKEMMEFYTKYRVEYDFKKVCH